MSYRHVLLALDPQHDPGLLLPRVQQLLHTSAHTLTLISVLPPLTPAAEWAAKRDWLDQIEGICSSVQVAVHEVRVESGEVAEQLRLAVEELQADVLVLGHHPRMGGLPPLLGRLLPLTGCDVLVLDPQHDPWRQPPRMQVAVSLDVAGFALLQRALQVAHQWHAVPEVLHCVSPLAQARLAIELEGAADPWLNEAVARAEHQLADWMARLPAPVPRWQVLVGEPGVQLLRAQQHVGSDLLLLGDHSLHAHLLQQHALPVLQQGCADLLILHAGPPTPSTASGA